MLVTTIHTFAIFIYLKRRLLKLNYYCAFLQTQLLLSTKAAEAFVANTLLFGPLLFSIGV